MIIEFLIFIVVLLNYFVKKNLYEASLLGMILTAFYLLVSKSIPLDIFFYKSNFDIYVKFLLTLLLVFSFYSLNIILEKRGLKKDLKRTFNIFFEDKKAKLLFLFLLSVIFYNSPILGLILLSFLATFLNFSSLSSVIIPFIFITSISMSGVYISHLLILNGKLIYFEYLILFYVLMFLLVSFERIIETSKVHLKTLIIDFLFYTFFAVLNTFLFLLLDFLYPSTASLIVSLVIIEFVMLAALRRYKFLIIDNSDESLEVSESFKSLPLPYISLIFILFLYLVAFLISVYNLTFGIIIFIFLNNVLINRILKEKVEIKLEEKLKIGFLFLISAMILMILKYEALNINDIYNKISDFYLVELSSFKNMFLIFQNFTFIPYIDVDLNTLTSGLEYTELWKIKIYLLIKIQVIMSFFNIFIVGYILNIKKKEMFAANMILMFFLLVFQIILYIY